MVLVSYSGREINAKLVYYGPGLSGKTTNLEAIYAAIPDSHRGKMVSMKTKTERTLFFDFLPIQLGELSGFKTRFLLYTVPGQVYYNATRKLVLKGVDAVVFVADSKRGKMDENLESLQNLEENLKEHGLDLDTLPWVIQYNKRDLPDVYTVDELERALNPRKVPSFEASARTGEGVVESFKTISRMLLKHLSQQIGVRIVSQSEDTAKGQQAAAPAGPYSAPTRATTGLQAPAPSQAPPAPVHQAPAPPQAETRPVTGWQSPERNERDLVSPAPTISKPTPEPSMPTPSPEAETQASEERPVIAKPEHEEATHAWSERQTWPSHAEDRPPVRQPVPEAVPSVTDEPSREFEARPLSQQTEWAAPTENEGPGGVDPSTPLKVERVGMRLRRWFAKPRETDDRTFELERQPEPETVSAETPQTPMPVPEKETEAPPHETPVVVIEPAREEGRTGAAWSERPERVREVPIQIELEPDDLEHGVILKLRISVRKASGPERDDRSGPWMARAA